MKRNEEENEEFRKYREQMHGTQDADDKSGFTPNKAMRGVFALIMVIVYIGMGILLLINFFGWTESIAWLRWIIGVVLIVYGIFRAWRQWAGIDSRM